MMTDNNSSRKGLARNSGVTGCYAAVTCYARCYGNGSFSFKKVLRNVLRN
jgi:hypothetical protein